MKYLVFDDRINVPCTSTLKVLIEETAKEERMPMTAIARRWLEEGAKQQLGAEYVSNLMKGIVNE